MLVLIINDKQNTSMSLDIIRESVGRSVSSCCSVTLEEHERFLLSSFSKFGLEEKTRHFTRIFKARALFVSLLNCVGVQNRNKNMALDFVQFRSHER